METLSTPRTVLRPWRPAEADRLLDILGRWEVSRWLDAEAPPMADLDAARAEIDRWRDGHLVRGRGTWAVEERATGTVTGSVLLSDVPDSAPPGGEPEVQIGWHLHPDATGRGLAREAGAALRDAAFALGHPRVHVLTYPDNEPSIRVALALGFRDQGLLHDQWYPGPSRHLLLTAEDHAAPR